MQTGETLAEIFAISVGINNLILLSAEMLFVRVIYIFKVKVWSRTFWFLLTVEVKDPGVAE